MGECWWLGFEEIMALNGFMDLTNYIETSDYFCRIYLSSAIIFNYIFHFFSVSLYLSVFILPSLSLYLSIQSSTPSLSPLSVIVSGSEQYSLVCERHLPLAVITVARLSSPAINMCHFYVP